MNSLALKVQEGLKRDPHAGGLYVFHGKRGHLIKILWHDGIGMSLYAKPLERDRFLWPSPADGIAAISAAQLAYMLDGIDWRDPVRTGHPEAAALRLAKEKLMAA
jgi:transposase